MLARYVILAIVAAASCAVPSSASAAAEMTRRDIRSVPIVERPSRPGHFYGNAVRRNNSRKTVSRSAAY